MKKEVYYNLTFILIGILIAFILNSPQLYSAFLSEEFIDFTGVTFVDSFNFNSYLFFGIFIGMIFILTRYSLLFMKYIISKLIKPKNS